MSQTTSTTDLAALRTRIDDIDARIIALLGKRFEATKQIGLIKARLDVPAIDAEREVALRKRYADLATQHELDAQLVQTLFRIVIDEVVVNHKMLVNSTG